MLSEYYIFIRTFEHWKDGLLATVYVKEGEFFRSQGGLEKDWGKNWQPIMAESIEDARRRGHAMVNSNPPPWVLYPKPDSYYE
jgi:hypothetical protein